jgi:hypothetical protein
MSSDLKPVQIEHVPKVKNERSVQRDRVEKVDIEIANRKMLGIETRCKR